MSETISQIIRDSLCNDESLSVLTDVLENQASVDILEKIPFVSYAISLLKIGNMARDRWMLRKMAVFIRDVNLGLVSEENRTKALEHFKQDEKTQQLELDYVLQILDRYLEEDKSSWFAQVYVVFVKGGIDLSLMKTFAEIINRFLPGDFEALEQGEKEYDSYELIPEPYLRLESLGLMQKINRIISDSAKLPNSQFNSGFTIPPFESGGTFKYTSLGKKLYAIFFPSTAINTIELDSTSGMFFV